MINLARFVFMARRTASLNCPYFLFINLRFYVIKFRKMNRSFKQSVLYLDDELTCLDVFRDLFSDEYEVRTARTIAEARRILEDFSPDVIISDQRMPEMSGTEFLREVAATHPSSRRALLTGEAMVGDVIREISAGVVQMFVTKPWTESDMRQILEHGQFSD
jgi:response regulator RpfG family c-di-GMP phosphodiesterase